MAGSFLAFFLIYTLFARMLSIYLVENLNDYAVLALILFGMLSISFVITFVVGIYAADKYDKVAVRNSSLLAFLTNFIFLTALCYIVLYVNYPKVFVNLSGFDYVLALPAVYIEFSVYILGHPMNVVLLSIISGNFYFLMWLIKLGVMD